MRHSVCLFLMLGIGLAASSGTASAQADPPGRVGRIAYVRGPVSFHDARQDAWSPAALNRPITTGDSLSTEPNGHGEIQIGGTRVRMDGNSELDVLALDDSQTRLQLDRGRLDIRVFSMDNGQPYQVLTPRGMVMLEQQGDYYIHAGSADDATVLGVRAGAARIEASNGQVLAVRSGEQAELIGGSESVQLRLVHSAPPSMPAYWAERDRMIGSAPPQYLSAGVTGYEDLAHYGAWTADPEYGEVWYPNSVPVGWQPYGTGYWTYVGPWGWTWVDAQPWGFAPFHYGRWAHRGERWCWIPPQRAERPVYAPALVAFVGGSELGAVAGLQNRAPVGWFPLGPHEPYVPPYVADPNYYRRINATDRVQQAVLDEHWRRAERHEASRTGDQPESWLNRRFATVVPAEDFAHSRPVQQVALKIAADKLGSAPVAPVAAPPMPDRPLAAALQAPANRNGEPQAHASRPGALPALPTRFANMEQIGRPAPATQPHAASGPKIVEHTNGASDRSNLPPLLPHPGAVPPSRGAGAPAASTTPSQASHQEPQRPAAEIRRAEPPPPRSTPSTAHPEVQKALPERPPPVQRPAETHASGVAPPRQANVPAPAVMHPAEGRHAQPQAMPQHVAPQVHAPASPPQQAHAPMPPPVARSVAPPPQVRAPAPPPAPHPAAVPQQSQAPRPAPQGQHNSSSQGGHDQNQKK